MFGSLLGAIAGPLIGGLFGDDQADENRAAQATANDQNYAAQKEFAQNGLQWKANDARAAGLHPMAAIGGAGAAFSPSFAAGGGGGPTFNIDTRGLFDDMDSMKEHGQNTNRAQRAVMTDEERQLHAIQVRHGELQNALLESQLAQNWGNVMGQPSSPPAPGPSAGRIPAASGQVKQGVIQLKPSPQESSRVGDAGASAGDSPLFRRQHVSNNSSFDMLSPEFGEAAEAYGEVLKPLIAGGAHAVRLWDNTLKPHLARGWANDKARFNAWRERSKERARAYQQNWGRSMRPVYSINPRERR